MPTKKLIPTLDHTFSAPIEKDGVYPTFVTFGNSLEVLGTKRPVKIEGTIDGHPFQATLMPSGQGPHWLPLRAEACKATGKSAAGQDIEVRLTKRHS